ncbi:hypothetical protein Nepgr_019560 [Nepenthes gracilis]|uniref:Uncharacterized protein n=1 Tax=Nepenthes gracilis TaxID=150966 RepID=A0AAD3SW22_NEPGR|nr:hypothetical protein Nepgr_019560 [Nepenthes gracilis]
MDKPSRQLAIHSGPASQHISALSRITTTSAVQPPSYFNIVIHITERRAIKSATAAKDSKRNSNTLQQESPYHIQPNAAATQHVSSHLLQKQQANPDVLTQKREKNQLTSFHGSSRRDKGYS